MPDPNLAAVQYHEAPSEYRRNGASFSPLGTRFTAPGRAVPSKFVGTDLPSLRDLPQPLLEADLRVVGPHRAARLRDFRQFQRRNAVATDPPLSPRPPCSSYLPTACAPLLSQTGQPCDVTFYRRDPIIDVRVDQQLFLALAYGAGHKRLADMLNAIKFSDASTAAITDIWTLNPMPKDGFTEQQLASVDLDDAESPVGPNGEALRQMIRDTDHCTTVQQEDKYLRRFIAS